MHIRAETFKNATQVVIPDARLAAARNFCNEHGAAMAVAARLLGGRGWEGRLYRLFDRLREADRFSSALGAELIALHCLLTLQNPEPAWFLDIAPEDPVVLEFCLLADEVGRLLADIAGGTHDRTEGA